MDRHLSILWLSEHAADDQRFSVKVICRFCISFGRQLDLAISPMEGSVGYEGIQKLSSGR
jgi:hypothetical protein